MDRNKFVITIPVRNAENYIRRSLRSAITQVYVDYRIIVVDDASTDSTIHAINQTINKYSDYDRNIQIIFNPQRIGAMANHVKMCSLCDDDEIIVNLDGDDQLDHDKVLAILNYAYMNPDVWMTYGSYEYDYESRNPDGDCLGITRQIPPEDHTRRQGFLSSHLRTYKAWLFRRIEDCDLRRDGEYYQWTMDHALMFPMIEMAGPKHAKFMPEVLYLYNARNPMNEYKDSDGYPTNQGIILDTVDHIMKQRIYPQLQNEGDYPWR